MFKTKTDHCGMVNRFKTIQMPKDCGQKNGIDYQETLSPVVRYRSIKYLMAFAAD